MPSLRRISAPLVFVCLAAQLAGLDQPIVNWSAPPYWFPQAERGVRAAPETPGLRTSSIATVPTGPLPFFAIAPCRVVDTRPSQGFTDAYGPPIMAANAIRTFDVNSAPHCPGIPAGAEAYSLNFAVTETTGEPGDIRVFPTGTPPSGTSVLNWNFAGNGAIANAIVVPAGMNGSIDVLVAGFDTHLVVDVNGYYAAIPIVNSVNGITGEVSLQAGSNVSITPSGNTLTIASSSEDAWKLVGNSGTSELTNFVGTTDNTPLLFRVGNARALALVPGSVPSVVGGYQLNFVNPGVVGGTIGGGGANFQPFLGPNMVTDDFGTVAGGIGNRAGDNFGTTSDRSGATVGGGQTCIASGGASTVSGGNFNIASGIAATVAGGDANQAHGANAMVAGGNGNIAMGNNSFAAGTLTRANHPGVFIWGDSLGATISSTAADQFIVRATGGIWLGQGTDAVSIAAGDFIATSTGAHLTNGGVWTNNSDRQAKQAVEPIDDREILERLANLPITSWSYKSEGREVRHVGPMAQDFYDAFRLGESDRSIGTVDSDGVAFAAIQALYRIVREKDREVQTLRRRLEVLEAASGR